MTGNSKFGLRQLLRYLVFMVLSFFVVTLCAIYIWPAVILPAISGSSVAVFLLVGMVCGLPVSFLITYLASKLVVPIAEKIKGPRQWAVVYVVVLGYMIPWVLLAFIFETFTPFIPVIVSGMVLPLYILLLMVIVVFRTRARDRVEQLLERISGKTSND